jgi:hypothetical protein
MSKLSEQVKAMMESVGESQASVARDCGIDPAGLSRFLSGQAGLSLAGVERLMQHFRTVLVPEDQWRQRENVWQAYRDGRLRAVPGAS